MLPINPRRRAIALLAVVLLFSQTLPCLALPQGQQPTPPVTILTKEPKAELDSLNQQATRAYGKGDSKTAARLRQQGLDKGTP